MCACVGLTAAAAAGCGMVDGDEFRGGVPTHDTVALRVPGADATGALTASEGVQSALLGQKADTYVTTRTITAVLSMFNTSFVAVPARMRVEPAITSGPGRGAIGTTGG